jgi:hypothetical protein
MSTRTLIGWVTSSESSVHPAIRPFVAMSSLPTGSLAPIVSATVMVRVPIGVMARVSVSTASTLIVCLPAESVGKAMEKP